MGTATRILVLLLLLIQAANAAEIDASLQTYGGTEPIRVIIQHTEDSQIDIPGSTQLDIIDSVAAEVTPEQISELEDNPDVERIMIDAPVSIFLDDSIPLINASLATSYAINGTNITGRGVGICIIDTGVNYNSEALGSCLGPGCRVIAGHSYCANEACTVESEDPMDTHNHGTHVASIAASQNATYRGVAPGALIIAIKALNSSGSGYSSDIVSAIEWCISNRTKYNISVISMSLGGTLYSGYCDSDSVAAAANEAVNEGIIVTMASGNNAKSTQITSPACASNGTSVGATTKADAIASYSNSYEWLDILAPGSSITAFGRDNSTVTMSGTSMATPHVAGLAALLVQAKRELDGGALTPAELESVMKRAGKGILDSRNGFTFPRIDAIEAVTLVVDETSVNCNFGAGAWLINNTYVTCKNKGNINPSLIVVENSTLYLRNCTINATMVLGRAANATIVSSSALCINATTLSNTTISGSAVTTLLMDLRGINLSNVGNSFVVNESGIFLNVTGSNITDLGLSLRSAAAALNNISVNTTAFYSSNVTVANSSISSLRIINSTVDFSATSVANLTSINEISSDISRVLGAVNITSQNIDFTAGAAYRSFWVYVYYYQAISFGNRTLVMLGQQKNLTNGSVFAEIAFSSENYNLHNNITFNSYAISTFNFFNNTPINLTLYDTTGPNITNLAEVRQGSNAVNFSLNASDNIEIANYSYFVYSSSGFICRESCFTEAGALSGGSLNMLLRWTKIFYLQKPGQRIPVNAVRNGTNATFDAVFDYDGSVLTHNEINVTVDIVNATGYAIGFVLHNRTALAEEIGYLSTSVLSVADMLGGVTNITLSGVTANSTIWPGNYTLNVTLYDGPGNIAKAILQVYVEDSAPGITVFSPIAQVNDSRVALNASTSENASCSYVIGAESNGTGYSLLHYRLLDRFFADASYTLNLTCTDLAMNTNSTLISFNVSDTIAPGIASIVSGLETGAVNITLVTGEQVVCRYKGANASWEDMLNMTSSASMIIHNASLSLAGGTYTYYIACKDNKSNTGQRAISFTVDTATATVAASSGGGGGGGGSSAGSGQAGIYSFYWERISAGEYATARFSHLGLALKSVSFKADSELTKAQISVSINDTNASKGFVITAANIIASGYTINFTANKTEGYTVVLVTGDSQQLRTRLGGKDGEYTAYTTELGSFFILSESEEKQEYEEPRLVIFPSAAQDIKSGNETANLTIEEPAPVAAKGSYAIFTLIILLVILVIALELAVALRHEHDRQ